MENLTLLPQNLSSNGVAATQNKFIEANTEAIELKEIRDKHIIPVFLKDNEPAISHVEFVEAVSEAARDVFGLSEVSKPMIRVSHPIKGRTYEARHKKANELLPNEKTIYYERMAYFISLPNMIRDINGQLLELTIGGVKAYNLDNFNSTKGSAEHFKLFIGFKNTVCTNLCISTDGTKLDLKAKSIEDLYAKAFELFTSYDGVEHFNEMEAFSDYELTESQFAQLIGRSRLYQHLPKDEKKDIPELLISDTQISKVADCYYSDPNFNRNDNGSIDLWRFYNLLTGAVKSSYIDRFLERELNSFDFTKQVRNALNSNSGDFWYLN